MSTGRRCLAVQVDVRKVCATPPMICDLSVVTQYDEVEEIMKNAVKRFKRIDILVNGEQGLLQGLCVLLATLPLSCCW